MSSIGHTIHMLEPKSITIERDKRQRKVFTTDDLEHSIPLRGQIQPIVVTPLPSGDYLLIAGERRLTSFLAHPEWGKIKAIFTAELSTKEMRLIELEENVKRQDLSWVEQVEAILEIHNLYVENDPTWNLTKTSEVVGYAYGSLYRMMEVAQEIAAGNEKMEQFSGWGTAFSYLETIRARKKEAEEAKLDAAIEAQFEEIESYEVEDVEAIQAESGRQEGAPARAGSAEQMEAVPKEPQSPIRNADALKFFADYRGIPFNLLHFDFPYGVDLQDSDFIHSESIGETYEDQPEVYWELLGSFCKNINRVMSQQGHIIHWFSPKFYSQTLEFFEKNAPDLWVQDIPLVWLKTDNKGIMSDHQRRPRNITEFAFLITRGDRKLLKSVSNGYGAPTSKVIHQSEKPIPVLKHFFQMFVDSNTRMLDPTSGSGNALIAADTFNPDQLLGLEKHPEYYSRSVQAWNKYIKLKELSNG